MTIAVRDLDALNADNVAQGLVEESARVQEQNPHLDVRRGVIHDVLLYFHSLLSEQQRANVADYLAARSINAIESDPALADPELVDDVLSNFGVVRKEGSKATGEVAVVVSQNVTLTLATGFQMQANGKTFRTDRVYTAKSEEAQINDDGDRLLTELDDGNFRFTIFVTAEEEGASSQLAKDALITPVSVPANYVTSYAVSSFSGGKSSETNQQLITRLQQGIACKAPSNRVNMAAMLRQVEDFSRVVTMSIIGMGDPEMLRDKHWIFPVGGGGRVDWYVRSEERVAKKLLQKSATCISKDEINNTSTWQLSITRDDAPGFYELVNIRRLSAENVIGGFTVSQETRALDLTGDGFVSDIATLAEGDYSRFMTATVQFLDSGDGQSDISVADVTTYQLEARYLPLIAEIHDTISQPDVRSRPADVMVKAPVPCFLQLAFTVYKAAGQANPSLSGIKSDLARAVNTAGFVGQVYASTLQAVIAGRLLSGQTASAIGMQGRLRYPGGEVKFISSTEVLNVPFEPEKMVSARTVQFFLDPADIGISVITSSLTDL